MIGVMTLAMTIQQHQQGKENRQNDLQIADELRKQQRQLEDARRDQDHRLEDQRREQDRDLQEKNRRQDLQIAQATRQDLVLSTYLNEMTRLSIEFHFNLSKTVRSTVVRPKTLVALQQLDPRRKTLLIEYLYESNLIRGRHDSFLKQLTDIRGADLNNVDFNPDNLHHRSVTYLSLIGTQLVNATFHRCDLGSADFELASMKGASFRAARLTMASFYRTSLISTDFTDADVSGADFTFANLTDSNITDKQLRSTLIYHRAILPNGTLALYRNVIVNGDAARCSLDFWNIDVRGSIEIMHRDENCLFKPNSSRGDVSMSQQIQYHEIKTEKKNEYFVEIRLDIEKVLAFNRSSSVKLTKSFYLADGTLTELGECDSRWTSLLIPCFFRGAQYWHNKLCRRGETYRKLGDR